MTSFIPVALPATTSASTFLHLNPPHRAEQVGSLLRPPSLLERRSQFEAKLCSAEDLRKAEDEAIKDAVAFQQEVGLRTITDGEMRRAFFYEGMFEKLGGMEVTIRPIEAFKSYLPYVQFFLQMGMTEAPSIHCTGRIRWPQEGVHVKDFEYLKSLIPEKDIKRLKQTICGPTWMHLRHGPEHTYDHSVYKTDEEYFADLVQAYREEIRALYNLGCRHIQFDDPTFAFFCADSTIEGMKAVGEDSDQLLDRYIRLYNDILQDRPAELTVGLHTCRGNFRGLAYCEGGYDRIAQKLFNNLNVDCYYLEYDNERAGSFEPLKHLPSNKVVVLGLVTTKSGQLETMEDIEDLINDACDVIVEGSSPRSRAYALNQICISPQCGFASVAEGNPITQEEQRQKLAFVVEAAKKLLE